MRYNLFHVHKRPRIYEGKNALTFRDGNVMFVGSINELKNDLAIHVTALVRTFVPFLCRPFVVKQGSDLFMEHLTGWHQRSLMVRGMEGRRISGKFSFGHTFYTPRTIL